MSEVGIDIHNRINRLKYDVKKTAKAIDWRLNPNASEARGELLELNRALSLDPDSPPRLLNIEVDGREYVSVRRLEGGQLYTTEDKQDNSFESRTLFGVDARLVPSGSIGILSFPESASCKNTSILEKFPEGDTYWSFFEWVLSSGMAYDPKDWKIDLGVTIFVKRIGDDLYVLDKNEFDKYDHNPVVKRVKPKNGRYELYESTLYLSQEEIDIKRNWYDTRARFYVLVKGSSEKQGVRQQPPVLQEVSQKV